VQGRVDNVSLAQDDTPEEKADHKDDPSSFLSRDPQRTIA
jgi:hypothetical protein